MADDLRTLQLKELELLRQFTDFCRINRLHYYVLGGTLLGAVRHKGFIPWDDDIDVGLPREDYDRFLRLTEEKDPGFTVHTYKNDPDHYRYFSKIEDPSVKVIRHDNQVEEVGAAWMDVFPLDGAPNLAPVRALWKYYILYRRAMYKLSCFSKGVNVNKKNRPLVERILVFMGMHLPVEKLLSTRRELDKLDFALRLFPYRKSAWVVNAMGAYKFNEMFHKKHWLKGRWYDFEGMKVWGASDYDFVLTQMYGDYMTPPPEDDRNHHGSAVIAEEK